jgi:transposase-like protein
MWYPARVEARDGAPKGYPMARGRSLTEFQKEFPDEASCAAFLFNRRWPDGFVCPSCGGSRAAALKSRAYTFECYGCRRQTSITAGTVMQRTRLALTVWFWAAHLMATHSNGMSARQLEDQLGLTYRTAWLLAQKLRRSMVDPDREPLEGVVEVDQAEVPFREGDAFFEPGNAGKILVIGAVEVIERDTHQSKPRRKHAKYLDTRSGRVRLAMIADNTAASLEAFVRANVKPGATLLTDGHASYPGLTDYRHDPRVVGKMAAHVVLPWIHRVFALMKRWGLGTYHGLRRKHVDTYLNEFVFRYNRRFSRHASFETVLGLTAHHAPTSYWDIVGRDNPRKGTATPRRAPRSRKTATGMRQDGMGGTKMDSQNQNAAVPPPLNMDEPGTTQ